MFSSPPPPSFPFINRDFMSFFKNNNGKRCLASRERSIKLLGYILSKVKKKKMASAVSGGYTWGRFVKSLLDWTSKGFQGL